MLNLPLLSLSAALYLLNSRVYLVAVTSRFFHNPLFFQVIDAQAELALQSDEFTGIDFQTLLLILNRMTLNVKETVIFDAVLSWSESECERQNLTVNHTNKREVLGQALHLLRIPAMTLQVG